MLLDHSRAELREAVGKAAGDRLRSVRFGVGAHEEVVVVCDLRIVCMVRSEPVNLNLSFGATESGEVGSLKGGWDALGISTGSSLCTGALQANLLKASQPFKENYSGHNQTL